MKSIISRVKTVEKKAALTRKKCIMCGGVAEYVMKEYAKNAYCRGCALVAFKYLNYLEKIEKE